jgi:DegV family protein with EDD domain
MSKKPPKGSEAATIEAPAESAGASQVAPRRFRKELKAHIIVDTPADFNPEVEKALGVEVIGFPVVLDGHEYIDDNWQTYTPHEFYDKMRHGATPTTSAVTPGRYYEIFKKAAEKGKPTIYLGFTEALSSSINAARQAQEMILAEYPDFELYVVDNTCPSAAAELLALEAVNPARLGATAEDLYLWANEAKYFINGVFTLENFDALARGGRIPAQAASLGGKLNIKPELTYDQTGALALKKVCRGRKKAMQAIIEDFREGWAGETQMPVAIVSTDAEKDADRLEEMLRKEPGCEGISVIRSQVSPVIGAHVGPGMLALIFWGKDRREKENLSDRIAKKVGIAR